MSRRVGFTGTQRGITRAQLDALRHILEPDDVFHHGDCIGADDQADACARAVGCSIVIHPPMNESRRAFCDQTGPTELREPAEYLDRNHAIVDECSVLIAAPRSLTEEQRSGTWATVRYARKMGRPVVILDPEVT